MILRYQKGWPFLFFPPPPIYREKREKLAPARPGELGCFLQKQSPSRGTSWKAQVGLVAICTPYLLNTPPAFFCWFFFRNFTELYEFCNDTCFPFVMLRNLMDYVIIPFLAFEMLQNLTDCVTMLPFDFRHVTELHGSCNNAFVWFLACYGTSRIVQQWVPSTSKRSSKGCIPSNNGPQTKLGYDSCPSLLTFYRR